eukprot:CAMPEP_0172189838 /NCGR_PEP_ID=MMETSP1050-20130122/22760_1 /TAXON_ID=233186 /ORGANISM="Cryptomonas curvata, Strain CCAP979/52" /LENGTH=381 /DNA_ID=CAMNT_0012864605 /DNA_START=249 /DNA_END=1390 /DNA_ORIENTATION=-
MASKTENLLKSIKAQVSSANEAAAVLGNLGFSTDQSETLLSISQLSTASAGDIILKEGSDILAPLDNSRIFLILSGEVTIVKANKFFATVSAGEFLGERRFLELEVLNSLGKLRSNPIEEIFAMVDEDKNGAVSSGELVAAVARMGVAITDADARRIIDKVDLNRDGSVSVDELIAASARLRNSLRQLFSRLDADGSGAISAEELRNALERELGVTISLEDSARCLNWIDINSDGFVTLSEAAEAAGRLRESPRLREAFAASDTDGDGRISTAELGPLLESLGLTLTTKQLRAVIDAVDADGDGGASLAELVAGLGRLRPGVLARFGSDVLRLYEAAALSTQQSAQVTATAAGAVRYASWTVGELRELLRAHPGGPGLEAA